MLEKKLKLYRTSANNLNIKERFPTTAEGELPLEIGEFTYDAKRMGGAPTIQCTIMYQRCLDDEWTDYVYTEFRGERYYLKQTPSSSKDNKSAMWKHECEFISERRVLDNVYFFDIVKADSGDTKPVSNSTDFTFFGNIFEFATRLTESMKYAGVDYVVDAEKHRTELTDATVGKQVTFQDKFISEALQEIFNVYGYHYYFEGKTIYIGESDDYKIGSNENPLEYGGTKELLSIQKNNANYKPINNICGRGSDQNIPYYYPNPNNLGETKLKIDNNVESKWDAEIDENKIDLYNSRVTEWDKIEVNKSENKCKINFYKYKSSTNYANTEYDFEDYDDFYREPNYDENTTIQLYYGQEQSTNIVLDYFAQDDFMLKGEFTTPKNMKDNEEIILFSNKGYSYTTLYYQGKNSSPQRVDECEYKVHGVRINGIEIEEQDELFTYRVNPATTYQVEVIFYVYSNNIPRNTAVIIYLTSGFMLNYWLEFDIQDYSVKIDDKEEQNNLVGEELVDYIGNFGIKLYLQNLDIVTSPLITIQHELFRYWQPQKNLQTNVYINSIGTQRFYPALNYERDYVEGEIINEFIGEELNDDNDKVININYKDDDGEYYKFENPYSANNQYQHIVDFPDIMPTIEGVKNDERLRIDMFSEFAYDDGDNNKESEDRKDNKDESGQLRREHPYFFGKLRKMPFNLFDHAIEGGEMTIAMTSGNLGSCKFVIHVGEEHQKNIVQVYEEDTTDDNGVFHAKGSLKRDDYGNVLCGRRIYVEGTGWKEQGEQKPQDVQNDTRTNEVWVALAKDVETFPSVMPYAPDGALSSYRPSPSEKDSDGNDLNNGDTFVLLNIKLPQAYIDAAQNRLTEETIKYLAENNKEKFTFSIDFSKVYLAMNPNILNSLNENSSVYIKYNDKVYKQFISSYSYKMSSKDALPEIKVELSETLSTQQGALQQVINAVKSEVQYSIGASGGSGFRLGDLDRQYIRRDTQDTTTGVVTFMSGTKYGKGKEDGKTSAEMQIDDENNSTLTVDNLIVRNNDERVQELIERIVYLESKINELTNN